MQPLQIQAPDKPHQEETVSKNQHWIYHIVNKKSITRDAVTHDELKGVGIEYNVQLKMLQYVTLVTKHVLIINYD